jgi:hypothetical protein
MNPASNLVSRKTGAALQQMEAAPVFFIHAAPAPHFSSGRKAPAGAETFVFVGDPIAPAVNAWAAEIKL